MISKGVGVNIADNETVADPDKLERKLAIISELGFDVAEIPVHAMEVIHNGRIEREKLKTYTKLLRRFPLKYSVHAPYDLNLFRTDDRETEQRTLLSVVEICGEIGADVLVYHGARYVGEEQFMYPQSWRNYSEAEKQSLLREEQEWLRRAGDRAQTLGVRIGIENLRPYPECPEYGYAVLPHLLAEQVRNIDHPQVGITLDVGHFYMTSRKFQLDMSKQMQAIAPHVIHLHVHDNFGKLSYSSEKDQFQLRTLGRGDLHMPIGTGEVPMDTFAEMLPNFQGYVIHELRARYENAWPSLVHRYRTHTHISPPLF